MDAKHEELAAGERRFPEHARRERLPLSKYRSANGPSPHALYSMRRPLREKGILPPKPSPSATPEQTAEATIEQVYLYRHPVDMRNATGSPRWCRR